MYFRQTTCNEFQLNVNRTTKICIVKVLFNMSSSIWLLFCLICDVIFDVIMDCFDYVIIAELSYNNKTVLLRDRVHQISRGESAAAGLTAGQPRPLTPLRRSGGPYHVTTQFYFYPVMSKMQNSINIYPWIWRRLACPTQDFRKS